MKKIIFITMFLLFFICPFSVSAEGTDFDSVEDFYRSSGAEDLYAGEQLEDKGISFENPKSILSLTPSEIWEIIKETAESKINAPLKLLVSVMLVIMLASVVNGMGGTIKNKEISGIFEIICILSAVGLIFVPVCECIDTVSVALSEGSEFMLGFVPVFSGLAAAGGQVTSATVYSGAVLGFSEVAITVAENFFIPLLSMCVSTAIVDACCDSVNLSGIINGVKKLAVWGVGLVMTIFTGLLSIQSAIGNSADSVAAKTAKYVLSNSIPLVGSAASDAYSSVKGSIILLKNGVGGIGIAALAVMLLPSLIHTISYKVCFSVLGGISEVFAAKKLVQLFKNINSILSVVFGILICFVIMFVISTGIVMSAYADVS